MAKTIKVNHIDTATDPVVTPEFGAIPGLNWSADFAVSKDVPGEAILQNVTSPLNLPESFRFAQQTVANVYTNTGVEKSMYDISTRGTRILVQLNETYTLTDSEDPSYLVALPISCHMVLTIPNNQSLTQADVDNVIQRMLAGYFDLSDSENRTPLMLRGSLVPQSMK